MVFQGKESNTVILQNQWQTRPTLIVCLKTFEDCRHTAKVKSTFTYLPNTLATVICTSLYGSDSTLPLQNYSSVPSPHSCQLIFLQQNFLLFKTSFSVRYLSYNFSLQTRIMNNLAIYIKFLEFL